MKKNSPGCNCCGTPPISCGGGKFIPAVNLNLEFEYATTGGGNTTINVTLTYYANWAGGSTPAWSSHPFGAAIGTWIPIHDYSACLADDTKFHEFILECGIKLTHRVFCSGPSNPFGNTLTNQYFDSDPGSVITYDPFVWEFDGTSPLRHHVITEA